MKHNVLDEINDSEESLLYTDILDNNYIIIDTEEVYTSYENEVEERLISFLTSL